MNNINRADVQGIRSITMHDAYLDNPEAMPTDHSRQQPNKGEIQFPEKQPVDPLASDEAEMMSHKGGLESSRTEFY